MAQVIFLHGASSSGKSTIAKALQRRIEKPFWHISIDHLRDAGVLPTERFKNGDFRWTDARAAFFDGFHGSLKAYADAGNDLILEHILDTEGWLETLADLLAEHDVFFAAVHCPIELLIDREAARGDRPIGSAKRDYETIHIGKRYDIELQSEDSTEANVEKLLITWRTGNRSSSFVEVKSA
ncbi:AAA family ATPase [Rhizobium hidalgonense]|uniref:AAA family ATPase n=1 Tax=Rhizobium hidalgonense TaxID=1538159 RepID=A0A2A6K3X9_9HYPH|nr:AAA family ATPase [Rhizobium hidalgonense]MDR9771690.1 AAA family ATPase [Rhizobium hidalgonense]MDR9815119.1 AAA family ATPase [Rhizobium hidalgonense]MDR9822529.1 AAA family ATPase [Rhizobium hidalgonense]PDT19258.1 chloramphenicol phosphotransferase [Rhizobium hidalgonense]PON04527.1 chloramphenicol phosphotransferase [Rhizobium hidalgonense]